jgi:hypothetical protein
MALARPIDGSTVMGGISCLFIVSSPNASPTFCLACLGFRELELKIQEREKKLSQNHHEKATKNTSKVEEEHSYGCLIFSAAWRSTSPTLPSGGPWSLWVTRSRITTRRALTFLGSSFSCPLSPLPRCGCH